MKRKKVIWYIPLFICVVAAAVAVVMLLWNALIPSIIGWSAINYWQAAGLLVLCRLLFGGFKGHMHRRRGHFHGKHSHLHEKLDGMTPEEKREYIRKRMFGMRGFDEKRGGFAEEKPDHDK